MAFWGREYDQAGQQPTPVMAKPDPVPVIICFPPLARFAAYSMFLLLVFFWIMTGLFIWLWWPKLSSMELAALGGWFVILGGTSVWWMVYYFSRLVFWAELDDDFRLIRLTRV